MIKAGEALTYLREQSSAPSPAQAWFPRCAESASPSFRRWLEGDERASRPGQAAPPATSMHDKLYCTQRGRAKKDCRRAEFRAVTMLDKACTAGTSRLGESHGRKSAYEWWGGLHDAPLPLRKSAR